MYTHNLHSFLHAAPLSYAHFVNHASSAHLFSVVLFTTFALAARTMMSVGVETSHATLLQLQQEVVEKVDLSLLIPAMNTEGLLTPEQNSHVDNGLLPPQKRCRDLTTYMCGKGDDGLIKFYRCLRTTAVRHANHGHLADSMLQQWYWLSQHEPPPQPPPPILQPASVSQSPFPQHPSQSSATPVLPAQIHRAYDWLIKTVCGCLADRGVTVTTLTSAIQHSLHPLLNSLTANLSHFPNLLSIFQYLKEQQLCNPLDTDLLVYILHNSLQQIDLYEEVLGYWRRIDHIQINCSECRFMQATVTSTEFLYMMAHHPSLTIAVRDVRRMKEFLANHLNLHRHLFWFCGSRVGSLITVWQFSGSYSKELQSFLDNTSALQSLNPPVSSVCLQSGPDTIASVEVCSVEKLPSPDTMDSQISSTTVTPSYSGKGTNYRLNKHSLVQ